MSGPESHVHKYKVATVQRRSEAFRVVCAGTGLLLYIGLQTSVDIERDMLPAAMSPTMTGVYGVPRRAFPSQEGACSGACSAPWCVCSALLWSRVSPTSEIGVYGVPWRAFP